MPSKYSTYLLKSSSSIPSSMISLLSPVQLWKAASSITVTLSGMLKYLMAALPAKANLPMDLMVPGRVMDVMSVELPGLKPSKGSLHQ